MSPTSPLIHGACHCGQSSFSTEASPLLRFVCHCNICQAVYGKPFADIVAFKLGDVAASTDVSIEFKRYRSPPAVNRGVCPACRAPVFGHLTLFPAYGFTFVPTVNLPREMRVPAPSLHSFYDRRQADVLDDLPKHSGYWASQWAVARRLVAARFRSR